jgi:hypothetical protein
MKTEIHSRRLTEEQEQHVREAVLKCAGTIEDSPDLAENARSVVRARIAKRHGF